MLERRLGRGLVLLVLCAWAGCSSSSGKAPSGRGDGSADAADGGTDTSAQAEVGGAGAGDAQADGASDLAPDGASDVSADGAGDAGGDAAAPTAIELKAPTFTAAKSAQSTQCVMLDLGNAQTIHVGHVKTTLSAPVYEVRIGAVTGAVQATPTACTPFADIMDSAVRPLVFARNDVEELSFPAGVGYTLAPHQLLRVEIHTWNPTNDDLPANVSTIFTVSKDADFQHEAGLLLLENLDVQIAAGAQTVQLGPQFFPLAPTLGAASIFRLEGYTHELGIDLTMSLATGATDPAPTSIYAPAPWNPANPLIVDEATAVAVPTNGGITLTCKWNNANGATQVQRGPSVMDERCAGFVSYYPAVAARACLHMGNSTGPTVCL
jgi:hypothetical protein